MFFCFRMLAFIQLIYIELFIYCAIARLQRLLQWQGRLPAEMCSIAVIPKCMHAAKSVAAVWFQW
jgi:hypothetical protein